jgi:hypothetical protein
MPSRENQFFIMAEVRKLTGFVTYLICLIYLSNTSCHFSSGIDFNKGEIQVA